MYETYSDGHVKNVARRRAKRDGGARGAGRAAVPGEAPLPSKAQAIADFEPLLAEFAVDIFFAGHDHNYEVRSSRNAYALVLPPFSPPCFS